MEAFLYYDYITTLFLPTQLNHSQGANSYSFIEMEAYKLLLYFVHNRFN